MNPEAGKYAAAGISDAGSDRVSLCTSLQDHQMPRSTVIIPADYPPLVSASPVLAELDRFADFELFTDRPQSADEIVQRLHNADILLNSRGSLAFPESLLKRLPRLQMIAVCGIGYDSIHLPTATQ